MSADPPRQVSDFQATLQRLVRDYPDDADFWPEFAAIAIAAERDLRPEDLQGFHEEQIRLLREYGKLLGESPES